ncbi:hypothetical protein ACE1AT_20425 [Pelatocladus sp. BLCC-F211]|uniref:hypothetical protein n=1 Tax=Pelatocladus sp. BLCC-F211 TaxID=3342752 RepID=UPI0035B95F27
MKIYFREILEKAIADWCVKQSNPNLGYTYSIQQTVLATVIRHMTRDLNPPTMRTVTQIDNCTDA